MDPYNNMDKWVTEPEFVEEGDEAQRRGYNLHKDMKHCGKNDQHLNFIPFKFFLGKESTAFKVIEILGNLTVRISAFSKQRIKLNASGMLFRLVEIENLDYGRDRCLFFVIITAKHVISNDTEAKSATVEFFNEGDNRCDSYSARGIKVLESNNEGDFSEVLCMATNKMLAVKIKNLLDFNKFKLAHRDNLLNIFIEGKKLNNPISQNQSDLNTFKEVNKALWHINQFHPKEQLLDSFTHPVKFDFRIIGQLHLNMFLFEVMLFCQRNGICTRNVTTKIELLDKVFKNSQERKTVITLVENLFKCKMTNLYIHICYPYDKSKQVTGKLMSTESFIGPYIYMNNTLTCCGGPVFIIPRECLELSDDGEIQLDKIFFLPPSKTHREVANFFSWRDYFDSSMNNTLRLNSNQHSQIDNLLPGTVFREWAEELWKFQNLDEELWSFRNLHKFTEIHHYESKHSDFNLFAKVCILLNIIEILGKLTVRVAVFSGTPNEVAACGMLFRIVEIENLDDQPGDDLYFTIVIPKHLISIEEHVNNATVEFSYCKHGDCDIKYASCVELLRSDNKYNFSEVVCKTNDMMLAAEIKQLFDLKSFKQTEKCTEIKKPSSQYKNIKTLDKVFSKINRFYISDKLLNQTMELTNIDAHHPLIKHDPSYLISRILKAKIKPDNIIKSEFLVDALWVDLNNMEKSYTNMVLKNLQERNPLMISSIEAVESLFKDEQNDLCIHIGHPHGMSKQVTIGEVISTDTGTGHYTFMYNTPTCPGCSGGPVFVVPRECLKLDVNGELQFDKIYVMPHSNAFKNEEKFSCNRSSSWMIYLDGTMNETLRISLPDEVVNDISKLLKDALPSMQ
ncbi:uncharacterized protein LOC131931808 [Physella acuta]|uniref:uncharacterized protein LOC131931808 n=1 Tax=Physella acuta TaxID=109671 RepID=UPI0027DAC9C8|nr:uncharacterized protein LOC131931808 [Physella acuta]